MIGGVSSFVQCSWKVELDPRRLRAFASDSCDILKLFTGFRAAPTGGAGRNNVTKSETHMPFIVDEYNIEFRCNQKILRLFVFG